MPDRESIRCTLLQVLRDDTAVEVETLADDMCLRSALGLDSVDFVGLIMRIEGEYRIRLTHEELGTIATVGDLLNLIQSKANSACAAA
ncbi:MAG: acyl carrier protein [Gemmataceae bacterium]